MKMDSFPKMIFFIENSNQNNFWRFLSYKPGYNYLPFLPKMSENKTCSHFDHEGIKFHQPNFSWEPAL